MCALVQGAAREKEGGIDRGEGGRAGGGQISGWGRARKRGVQVYLVHKTPPPLYEVYLVHTTPPPLYDPAVAPCLVTNGDPMGSERFV